MCVLPLPQIDVLSLAMEVRLIVQKVEHDGERFPVGFFRDLRGMGICAHARGARV